MQNDQNILRAEVAFARRSVAATTDAIHATTVDAVGGFVALGVAVEDIRRVAQFKDGGDATTNDARASGNQIRKRNRRTSDLETK